jgi:hypothetical protein
MSLVVVKFKLKCNEIYHIATARCPLEQLKLKEQQDKVLVKLGATGTLILYWWVVKINTQLWNKLSVSYELSTHLECVWQPQIST